MNSEATTPAAENRRHCNNAARDNESVPGDMLPEFTHMDLYSGKLGFSLAAQQVWGERYNPVVFCEMDEFCQRIIRRHRPGVPIVDRAEKIANGEYSVAGTIDLLTAGFPCQPYSVAGKRQGANDGRDQWPTVAQILRRYRPRWALLENVAGLASMEQPDSRVKVESKTSYRTPEIDFFDKVYSRSAELQLFAICEELEEIGYTFQVFNIPACSVNAVHKRERI